MDAKTTAAIDSTRQAIQDCLDRLAELKQVPVPERVYMTYTLGGKSVGYNEYRASILAELREHRQSIKDYIEIDKAVNQPVFTHTQVVRG